MNTHAGYAYDALGLLARVQQPDEQRWTFWQAGAAVNEVRTAPGQITQMTWLRAAGIPCAEKAMASELRMTLLGAQQQGSVVLEVDALSRAVAYAPHGHRQGAESEGAARAAPGYTGEHLDAASGCYLLGPGHHRPYSPTLGLFLAPDSASPFGRGGLNSLAYCSGDPINCTDPTGHWIKWLVAGIGMVLSAVAVVASVGLASAAVGAVVAGGIKALTVGNAAAIAGTTLGVAGMAVEGTALAAAGVGDDKTAGVLGWVGLGLGVAGLAPALVKAAGKAATKLADRYAQFGGRLASRSRSASGPSNAIYRNPLANASSAVEGLPPSPGVRPPGVGTVGERAVTSTFRNPLATPGGMEASIAGRARAAGNFSGGQRQGGLRGALGRIREWWNPQPVSASPTGPGTAAAYREIPVNLPEYERIADFGLPTYQEALSHPVLDTTRVAPAYEIGPPPVYRRYQKQGAWRPT